MLQGELNETARMPAIVATLLLLAACTPTARSDGRLHVVAGFYPLAWAARAIGGDTVRVDDLTPPGGEAHEIQLTAGRRSAIQRADVVLLAGKGFQAELERAARDAGGRVLDVLSNLSLLPSREQELGADPHVWLDPLNMRAIAAAVAGALAEASPAGRAGFETRAHTLDAELAAIDQEFRSALGRCALRTLVTTHEAFAYLANRYGLTQLALTGQTPEAEPAAGQIQRVREAAQNGAIGAIFYENTDEGIRIGRSVAADVGVPALPLNTLESDPGSRDYPSQMRENLRRLVEGLQCR